MQMVVRTGMNCASQIACPIEVRKSFWVSNRLVDPPNTMPRRLMSTGEPVMKTYALHLYCQHFGFRSWTYALVDEMKEHSIGIYLFNVCVRNDIAISSRQENLGWGRIFTLDGGNHSGVETCSQTFGPENAIFTVQVQLGFRDSRFANDSIKFVGEVHYCSERNASYRSHVPDKYCIGNREKDTYL